MDRDTLNLTEVVKNILVISGYSRTKPSEVSEIWDISIGKDDSYYEPCERKLYNGRWYRIGDLLVKENCDVYKHISLIVDELRKFSKISKI